MKRTYFIKRLIRRHIPAPVFYRIMKYSGRAAAAEKRPADTFQALRDRLRDLAIDLADKHVLELGSGRYARLALQMLNAGASRVTLADFYAKPLSDPRHRRLLVEDCARYGLDAETVLASIDVVAGDFLTTSPLGPTMKADLIISTAVLEHVRDPLIALEKSWEWLRPGGYVSHIVDLRDHLFDTPFEMLTYSNRTWNRWLNPRDGFHLNRWRLPDYLQAMRKAGFESIDYRSLERDQAGLMEIQPRLSPRFRDTDPELLSITIVHLHARKPRR